MIAMSLRGARAIALTGLAAGALALTMGMSLAAEPGDGPSMRHEEMVKHFAEHVQEHLDKLAARLEIKASQQAAWQAFSGAFRDAMMPLHHDGKPATPPDATTLVREHAERAAQHAQTLARLADATAKLEQALGPDQRTVLDEVARHFAQHHPGPGMMMGHDGYGMMGHGAMAHDGHPGYHEDHCEGGDGEHDGPQGHGMPEGKDEMPAH